MELDVKHFLVLNGLIIGIIAYSMFVRGRRSPKPTNLDMRAGGAGRSLSVDENLKVRELNAKFEFAGQSYDAYEILDVPAGCSATQAEANYQELRSNADEKRRNLIDRAFMEIRKRS